MLVKTNLENARREQKIHYDKRAKTLNYVIGDKVLLDTRVIKPGTSKKLNPKYQGPYRVSKVNKNSTVEITSYNGAKTILTHVNRIKPLFETMVWRDEECVDFYDLRNNQNKPVRDDESDSFIENSLKEKEKEKEKGIEKRKERKEPEQETLPLKERLTERRTGLRPQRVLKPPSRFIE